MKNPLWGGRFTTSSSDIMKKINESISFDKTLYEEDIAGSIAHCKMLINQKIINKYEGQLIIHGLEVIQNQISSGALEFSIDLEDIHMNIEHNLKKMIGNIAGKLHTARSRNDQVATDFKLWIRKSIVKIEHYLHELQETIINMAELHYDTIMPGFTHLQIAQPVTLGHHLMAYFEMFKRDFSRYQDLYKRMNQCPLGSAALAGTSFPIDRHFVAQELGFYSPTENSIDAVSDRDYAIEFLSNASICIMHLSRLAEEIILWCSYNFKFITLSDNITTGSSIMPQKKNPDAAELIRGKTGRIFASLNQILVVMKGLPLAYSKDMQEDKEAVFDAANNLMLCIEAMNNMLTNIIINKNNMLKAAEHDYSTATDLADWLVKNLNLSFRESHEMTGQIVRLAEHNQCKLHELTLEQIKTIIPTINETVFSVLSVENSVASRTSYGGTAPTNVMEAIKKGKAYLSNIKCSQ
ncbi:argininosuccinate lyase [Ehrlichia minasensis]|uniref:Argininosuccinate lyase n=1 Tax=Ehrlichia minasensis TaxID=1242993 RepID=A0A4Q6IB92_9RICK|nr:argininosuccinate lyase [Ehrlichia minasensis]RZB12568.1 argininosuccinate lyase [Ehrlichia minasensis]